MVLPSLKVKYFVSGRRKIPRVLWIPVVALILIKSYNSTSLWKIVTNFTQLNNTESLSEIPYENYTSTRKYESTATEAKEFGEKRHVEVQNLKEVANTLHSRLIILTMNRLHSLKRLLDSLKRASYFNEVVFLDIWIDRNENGTIHQGIVDYCHAFSWIHGQKNVNVRKRKAGLYKQWIWTWNATSKAKEFAVILEDDLEVAPQFYEWLIKAREKYAMEEDIAGFTLQRHTLVPNQTDGFKGPLQIPKEVHIYKYKLHGTWGFAPNRDRWIEFQKWFTQKQERGEKPYVEDLITTRWYISGETEIGSPNMWSQWFIRFCYERNYYTVTANLPGNCSLARNWKENGLHFNENSTSGQDFPVCKEKTIFIMPRNLVQVGFNGKVVDHTDHF